ncbi:MAG: GNAT family N-acetyltransferase [Kiritimatiellaeota bacterium]|nr:GNAT family N-acetyltransferase [Kiritimatiellota bacterium]
MSTHKLDDARASDRAELLDFLHAAFCTNDPNSTRFETLYPDLFELTDTAMSRHRVIRDDAGRICACVGAYPMRVHVGACAMDVFGIGQVSCSPSLRGGGRMTALMNDACERMEKSGAALAWLGGRRDRYAHFGFDLAGSNFSSGMDKRSAGEPPPGWRVEQLETTDAPPPAVWALRGRAAVREEISPKTWLARLMRGGKPYHVFTASRGADAEAYAMVNGDTLLEWAGETAGIHAICAHLLQTQKHVNATYSPAVDPAAKLFWDCAAWSYAPLSNLRILNLGALLKSCAPFLEGRVPTGVGARLAIAENNDAARLGGADGPVLALDRLTMVRLVFGPLPPSRVVALPENLRWLDRVFPLPFLLNPSSHV